MMLYHLPTDIICQIAEFCPDKNRILLKKISRTFNEILTPEIAFQSWCASNCFKYVFDELGCTRFPLRTQLCLTILNNAETFTIDDRFAFNELGWIELSKKYAKLKELQITEKTKLFNHTVLFLIEKSPNLKNVKVQKVYNFETNEDQIRNLKVIMNKRKTRRNGNINISVSELWISCRSEEEVFQFANFGVQHVEHLILSISLPINSVLNYSTKMPNWWKTCDSLETYNWALLFSNSFVETTTFKKINLRCFQGENADDYSNIVNTNQFKNRVLFLHLQHLNIDILALKHNVPHAAFIYEHVLKLILLRSPNLHSITFTNHVANSIDQINIENFAKLILNYCAAFYHLSLKYYTGNHDSFIEICAAHNNFTSIHPKNQYKLVSSITLCRV